MTNINLQGLAAKAALTGDPEMLMQAVALDPLTSAVLTLKEIRDMVNEMLEAQRKWLPQFKNKTIRKTPVIKIPKNVKRAQVPLDPALAIANRFGKLAS
jgi:alpha-galactosidase